MKEYFENKKQELLLAKEDIQATDYSEKVTEEVEAYRLAKEKEIQDFANLTASKYENKKAEDLKKIDYYLEFVEGELSAIAEKEQAEVVAEVDAQEVAENSDEIISEEVAQ